MKRNLIWQISGLVLALALGLTTWSVKAGDTPAPASQAPPQATIQVDDLRETYPIMRPDHETLMRWVEAYESAHKFSIEQFEMYPPPRGSKSLLSHLQYTPSQRNQGSCGNCWVWAGTGVMSIDLSVNDGILDRLSTQYINSCKTGSYACCGANLSTVASFYTSNPQAIPWSNTNASFADGTRTCASGSSLVSCGSISTSPDYPISSISDTSITTHGVSQSTAIANIKAVLDSNKAVYFAFYLADDTDWGAFFSYWNAGPETALWDPDPYCGHTWVTNQGGGHAVLCVGYNDDDPNPANHYWIMVNSWGTAGGNRPNGIFRMKMNINYGCTIDYYGSPLNALLFQTLNITWQVSPTAVLWNQPPNTGWAGACQDFETTYNNYDIFNGDDFTNTVPWTINTIYVPGEWSGTANLNNATSLNFYIYANSPGVPAGYPDGGLGGSGTPVWSLSVAPSNSQVTLSAGTWGSPASTVTLNLSSPINLSPGTYWLVFYPELNFGSYGQWGQHASDTANGYQGKVINPGDGFGYGATSWTNMTTTYSSYTQTDWAFRLEGTAGGASIVHILELLLLD